MIEKNSTLWQYLSPAQRDLACAGQFLIDDRLRHPNSDIHDYSYLVFPYAKLYEGFLKQLLRDLGIITPFDYVSTHFRIGKVLSPNLARRLGQRSAYRQLQKSYGMALATDLWEAWREGRNAVFHYFPHAIQALSESEALVRIDMLIHCMQAAVDRTDVRRKLAEGE